jgi:hypothetical protein
VLNDANQLEPIMEAWTTAGARGITGLPSIGAPHSRDALQRDDMPLFPSLKDLLEHDNQRHTLFTIADDAMIDQLVAAAQAIVGDFDSANTGILFTVPVGRALGLDRPSRDA